MGKSKKIALILIILSFALVTLVLIFYLQYRSKFSAVSPLVQITPTPILEELSTWTDPADFSFQYPKSLSLNPHDEDKDNYAHVELTSAAYPGNLIVWVKDTTAETVDGWVKQNKISNAIDSELANISAKKVLTADEKNKITLTAVNNGYLYQIEVNATDLSVQADKDFWNNIFSQIASTFKFLSSEKSPEKQPDAVDSVDRGADDSVFEGEEVIE